MAMPRAEIVTKQAQGTGSESGAVSDAEAALLLTEGKKAFAARKFERAASRFQRLVDRYPGYQGYLEAHLTLGQALLALERPGKAITPLKYYVLGVRNPDALVEGRVWLARAYLEDGHYNEAYLTTSEVETSKASAPALQTLLQQNQLIRARALQALNRAPESKHALESARKFAASNPTESAPLRGETLSVELEIKLGDCAKLPSSGPLTEDQVKNQFERRGTCLLETLPIYRLALDLNERALSDSATTLLEKAYFDFLKACSAPPAPPETHPVPRTPEQLRQYHRELKESLTEDCRLKAVAASGILSGWSGDYPKRLRAKLESPKK